MENKEKKINLNEENEKFTNNELVPDDFTDDYYSDEDVIRDILGEERYNKLNERRKDKTKEPVLVTLEEYEYLTALGAEPDNFVVDVSMFMDFELSVYQTILGEERYNKLLEIWKKKSENTEVAIDFLVDDSNKESIIKDLLGQERYNKLKEIKKKKIEYENRIEVELDECLKLAELGLNVDDLIVNSVVEDSIARGMLGEERFNKLDEKIQKRIKESNSVLVTTDEFNKLTELGLDSNDFIVFDYSDEAIKNLSGDEKYNKIKEIWMNNNQKEERILVTPEEYDDLVSLGFDAQDFTVDFNKYPDFVPYEKREKIEIKIIE
jgi:CheY-specific phosphatase CheX